MTNPFVPATISELRRELKRARLRSRDIRFTFEVPDRHMHCSTGYGCGYEAGWRGWDYNNPYTRSNWTAAYARGYTDALNAIAQEISQ